MLATVGGWAMVLLGLATFVLFEFPSHANAGLIEALSSAMGIQNCANKCNKVFDRQQYAISDQPNSDTFEFRSCIVGCTQCSKILSEENKQSDLVDAAGDDDDTDGEADDDTSTNNAVAPSAAQNDAQCFRFCKTFDYHARGIRKGVIEPDKACLMGCVINTCQGLCTGGTTDDFVTDANRDKWWGLGGNGCSIKSGGGYVQNPDYGLPNQPSGAGANQALKQCCSNALNLCNYNGDKTTLNFQKVEFVTRRSCRKFMSQQALSNNTQICSFFHNQRNCGTGLGGNLTAPTGGSP